MPPRLSAIFARPFPSRPFRAAAFILLACLAAAPAAGQDRGADTLSVDLPEITVDAVRGTETMATAPFAVGLVARDPERLTYEPALTLDAVLRPLPGLWINDRGHFAVGERLAVRGMGARAAFGVRGVQVVLDGVPLTMPDGQAMLEIVEPSVLRRAELVRSPASLYWGNGSGGVLFLSSGAGAEAARLRVRGLAGSYGQRQGLVEARAPIGRHQLHGYLSSYGQEGYRAYSQGTRTRSGLLGRFVLGDRTVLRTVLATATQVTEHPGSLTRSQMEENPRIARPGFPETLAGKESAQVQGGAHLEHATGPGLLSLTLYGTHRDLENPLPFAYIRLGRAVGGVRAAAQDVDGRLQWGVGIEAAGQRDDRQNWENEAGEPGAELLVDQIESVQTTAGFGFVRAAVTPILQLTAGLRGDRMDFSVDDRLVSDGDDSGERLFTAWSPSVGLSYRIGTLVAFANYNTAFETPTTTELVNRPDRTGGLNPELRPQTMRGVEGGVRGYVTPDLQVDLAVFRLSLDDRLVSFQNEAGRDFYRNSGENRHVGVEAALGWTPRRQVELSASYTGGRFVFLDEALEGNRLPGVPDHRLYAGLEVRPGAFWGRADVEAVSAYYVNDTNTEENEAYAVVDLWLGHRGLEIGGVRVQPFGAVRNLFDRSYSGSIVINAAGGRFYEPAPGRSIVVGLQASL